MRPPVTPYIVLHRPTCRCQCKAPSPPYDAHGVAGYLFGRDEAQHVIYYGECPYVPLVADVSLIEAVLTYYPLPLVRHVLPLTITIEALRSHGVRTGHHPAREHVCRIGGPA